MIHVGQSRPFCLSARPGHVGAQLAYLELRLCCCVVSSGTIVGIARQSLVRALPVPCQSQPPWGLTASRCCSACLRVCAGVPLLPLPCASQCSQVLLHVPNFSKNTLSPRAFPASAPALLPRSHHSGCRAAVTIDNNSLLLDCCSSYSHLALTEPRVADLPEAYRRPASNLLDSRRLVCLAATRRDRCCATEHQTRIRSVRKPDLVPLRAGVCFFFGANLFLLDLARPRRCGVAMVLDGGEMVDEGDAPT